MKKLELNGLIIGVDFDGTCVTHDFPRVGKELPHCVNVLKKLVQAGAKLILWTMRSDLVGELSSNDPTISSKVAENYLEQAVNWFAERHIPLHGIQCNPDQKNWTSSPKCYCHLYIDDAALGCPLMYYEDFSYRPWVDWLAVDKFLFQEDGNGITPSVAISSLAKQGDQFEYNTDGHIKAINYLHKVNHFEKAQAGFSNDGWSVIQYANDVYRRLEK